MRFKHFRKIPDGTLFLFLLALLSACNNNESQHGHQSRKTITIAELRTIIKNAIHQSDTSLQQYTIQGYFSSGSGPMLISRYDLLRSNSRIPDSEYVTLAGSGADSVGGRGPSDTIKQYNGAFVAADVDLKVESSASRKEEISPFAPDDTSLVKVSTAHKPFILRAAERVTSFVDRSIKTVWPRTRRITGNAGAGDPNKFALLYSGGINSWQSRPRYWNDIRLMYSTLVEIYNFSPKNIFVIYTNGTHVHGFGDTSIPINYSATDQNVRRAVNALKSRITDKSTFFVYFTSHGGGWNLSTNKSNDGRFDTNQDEEATDTKKWDEQIYFYQQFNNNLWDDSLTNIFRDIHCKTFVALLEPCYSGGLIHDLRGTNRVLVSAANEYEESKGTESNDQQDTDYDLFSYYFIWALKGAQGADVDHDGKISILEAFNYAKSNVMKLEHPQLDDTTDGLGTNSPAGAGPIGKLANKTFLQ
jgi:hypothetical protein